MKPQIIALAGRAGSGKDTVGHILEQRGEGLALLSFATPLKQICRDVFAFTDEQLYGPSEARNAPDPRYPREGRPALSPREALQQLGTEWGRACYPDIWAELGVRRAQVHTADGHSVVFTDCRFANEARAVRAAGGLVWRIFRPEADAVPSTHASETEMDSPAMQSLYTSWIHNSDTLAVLTARVRYLADSVGL